ncbi:Alpha/Beta hydrolase protein [Crepidotus variabilis]|uniref:Alpha/Beta hydrolase protein n=1 Tax=Crepidotus variabilis TaxID=179855 RepID=A0A9P6JP38_9AGAR|nr:Alpha/Beta hydrolase protein [Crepidotus variabilis]
MSKSPPKAGSTLFRSLRTAFLSLVGFYVVVILLVMTPITQTYLIYAHHIDVFGYKKFDHPENYGLAPGKTVNLKLQSADNNTIGAWFIFSDKFYHQQPFPPPSNLDLLFPQRALIPAALKSAPTIIFLHGNTGTRAHHLRTVVYTALTSRLGANVLAIDYRGFGDSEGKPTVEGVSKDARAGWDYLINQGAKEEDVLVMGHSLGTAIAGLLSAQLAKDNITPRGTVLMSPFSSVRTLVDHYYLFGFLPLLKPLSMIPLAPRLVTWSLVHGFDTLSLVPDIKSSVLIAHADDDWDIPSTHSSVLFDAFLKPHLPEEASLPKNPLSPNDRDNYTQHHAARASVRAQLVSTSVMDGFGVYEQMTPALAKKEGRQVALLRTEKGSHDIGRVEGVQDAIGRMFGFYEL